MIKVLKTDIYRALKTKAFYAYPVFLVLIFVMEFLFATSAETYSDGAVVVEATRTWNIGLQKILECLSDGLLALFLGIFYVLFCTEETRNGFVKNAAGIVPDRIMMPISKIIVGSVVTVVYTLEYALLSVIFTLISVMVSGGKLEWNPIPEGDGGRYAVFVLLCVLVHVAIVAILTLLHEITHNKALGILFSFLYSASLLDKILIGFTNLLKLRFGLFKGVVFNNYLMFYNISDGYNGTYYEPFRLFVICLFWCAAAGGLALVVTRRKDIR